MLDLYHTVLDLTSQNKTETDIMEGYRQSLIICGRRRCRSLPPTNRISPMGLRMRH